MQPRNILIFGRAGQVGWQLRRTLACLGHVTTLGSLDVDFTRPDAIRAAIKAHEPSVIVNAAAYTAVDKAESEPERALAINATAPEVIAEEAKRRNALLIHYSTDYVYDGSGKSPWVETDEPGPLGVYGATKLAGDRAIEASGCDHLIFRTSWVYGPRGKNFLLTMLNLGKVRPEIRVVDDQVGAPTSSEAIAQGTASVLSAILAPGGAGIMGRSGVYHLACSGEASWCQFAQDIFSKATERLGRTTPKLVAIPSTEYPTPAKRPSNSRLSCVKLRDSFGIELPGWEESLDQVIDELGELSAG